MSRTCSIENCNRGLRAIGLCNKHYLMKRVHGDPLYESRIVGDDVRRFWSKVNKNGPTQPHMTTPCWLWAGQLLKDGYGMFPVGKQNLLAHRYSFFLAHGKFASPMTLHKCDVRSCIRPDHLYSGTQKQNVEDMLKRGRGPKLKGESNPKSVLTEQDIRTIRGRLAKGDFQYVIAKDYGVRQCTIGKINTRQTWAHI